MCLILQQRAGFTLSRDRLSGIIARNGDGFGAMWSDGQRLHHLRMVGSAAEMAEAYRPLAGRAVWLHWRMATHGRVDASMAHPFPLSDRVAFMHNGMLDCGTPHAGHSDTWHIAELLLRPIAESDPDQLFRADFAAMLGGLIGRTNKLAFLHADGRSVIINRGSGIDWQGCWWSNTYAWDAPASLTPRPTYTSHSGSSSYGGNYGSGYSYNDRRSAAVHDEDEPEWWTPRPTLPAKTTRRLRDILTDGDAAELVGWCEVHPMTCATLLADWGSLSRTEAEEIAADPETAAGWLAELADAGVWGEALSA